MTENEPSTSDELVTTRILVTFEERLRASEKFTDEMVDALLAIARKETKPKATEIHSALRRNESSL